LFSLILNFPEYGASVFYSRRLSYCKSGVLTIQSGLTGIRFIATVRMPA